MNCKYLYGTHGHTTPWCLLHKAEAECDGCKDRTLNDFEHGVRIGPLTNLLKSKGPTFTAHGDKFDNGGYPKSAYSSPNDPVRCADEFVVSPDKVERIKQIVSMYGGDTDERHIFLNRTWKLAKSYGMGVESFRRKLRTWTEGHWPDDLNIRLQEMAAKLDFEKIERRLLACPGIYKIHDEYVIGEKWKSPVKVGEVVTFKGAAHVVRKICGPLLTLQPLIGDDISAFDWEIQKRGALAWVKRIVKKLFPMECSNCGGKTGDGFAGCAYCWDKEIDGPW